MLSNYAPYTAVNSLPAPLLIRPAGESEPQVLPGRTHPNMHMSAASGFLLSGTKALKQRRGGRGGGGRGDEEGRGGKRARGED
jgi:hypothetical protein